MKELYFFIFYRNNPSLNFISYSSGIGIIGSGQV